MLVCRNLLVVTPYQYTIKHKYNTTEHRGNAGSLSRAPLHSSLSRPASYDVIKTRLIFCFITRTMNPSFRKSSSFQMVLSMRGREKMRDAKKETAKDAITALYLGEGGWGGASALFRMAVLCVYVCVCVLCCRTHYKKSGTLLSHIIMLLLDTRHTPHIRIHTTHMLHMRTTLQTLQRTALLPPPSHLFHQPTSWYQLTLAGTNEQNKFFPRDKNSV